jgi:hypothetical protein
MGYTIRYYLFSEGEAPIRLPRDLVERLSQGEDFLPAHSNTRRKVLEVVLDNVEGKPDTIVASRGAIWAFDEHGGVAESLREMLAGAMEHWWPETATGKVVDLNPKIRKKQFEEKHRWTATAAEIDVVAKDIFSNSKATGIKAAKGARPKVPPLTLDAKRAIRELSEPFYKIQPAIEDLKEPGFGGPSARSQEIGRRVRGPASISGPGRNGRSAFGDPAPTSKRRRRMVRLC